MAMWPTYPILEVSITVWLSVAPRASWNVSYVTFIINIAADFKIWTTIHFGAWPLLDKEFHTLSSRSPKYGTRIFQSMSKPTLCLPLSFPISEMDCKFVARCFNTIQAYLTIIRWLPSWILSLSTFNNLKIIPGNYVLTNFECKILFKDGKFYILLFFSCFL